MVFARVISKPETPLDKRRGNSGLRLFDAGLIGPRVAAVAVGT